METKKLVIGLKNVKGATRCIDWLEPLPVIGNYHETYLYLPTLTENVLGKIIGEKPDFTDELKDELFQAIKADLSIYCVTAPLIEIKGISNYDFFPFELSIVNKKIETFDDTPQGKYLPNVEFTDNCFNVVVGSNYLKSKITSTEKMKFSWQFVPILRSLHNKAVAFTIKFCIEVFEWNHGFSNWKTINDRGGIFIFLPPTTRIAPEKGLDILVGEDQEAQLVDKPEWFLKLLLPNEETIRQELEEAKSQKLSLDARILELENQLSEIEQYKWAFRLKDTSLEKIIDKIFEFLEVPLARGRKSQEDRWFEIEGAKIPVEIKGHENNLRRRDIRQIIDRTNEAENTLGKTAGILIANAYCEIDPNSRPPTFDDKNDGIINKATSFEVALLDIPNLMKILKRKMAGEDVKSLLISKLVDTQGLVNFDD